MTTADELEREYLAIPREECDFLKADALAGLIAKAKTLAVAIGYPHGEHCCDRTETFVFDDGSHFTVMNPRQLYFPAKLIKYRVVPVR